MDRITHDVDRDFFMTPEQSLEYGMIDQIIGKAAGFPAEGEAATASVGGDATDTAHGDAQVETAD